MRSLHVWTNSNLMNHWFFLRVEPLRILRTWRPRRSPVGWVLTSCLLLTLISITIWFVICQEFSLFMMTFLLHHIFIYIYIVWVCCISLKLLFFVFFLYIYIYIYIYICTHTSCYIYVYIYTLKIANWWATGLWASSSQKSLTQSKVVESN